MQDYSFILNYTTQEQPNGRVAQGRVGIVGSEFLCHFWACWPPWMVHLDGSPALKLPSLVQLH